MTDDENLISSMSYEERLEAADVTAALPNIVGQYRRTSDPTIDYNCLAWAVGNKEKWFSPERFCLGYHWPQGVEREWNMTATVKILGLYGYVEDSSTATFEDGYLKVAIYADGDGSPTHFARQLENGKWTSKLGELIDVEHDNLDCLEGDDPSYGKVVRILRKVSARL